MADTQKETSHLLAEENSRSLDSADDIHRVVLKWENLNFTIDSSPKPLHAIKNISGYANPGEILAIMGLSGCGKTSLLSLLSNQLVMESSFEITGDIWVNSTKIDELETGAIIRYIPQESILFEFMTPLEFLKFNLNLRVSGPKEEINARINKILEQFKLTKVKHSIIGGSIVKGLSGGEKKRVVIAAEMMLLPSVLILDEPTSGLDSFLAKSVFDALKTAAGLGVTVITTVHQPSFAMFEMIDRLCLMQEGRFVYQGRASDSVEYFRDAGYPIADHVNPPEFFIKLLRIEDRNNITEAEQKIIQKLNEKYEGLGKSIWNDIDQECVGSPVQESHFETGFTKSFLWLIWREVINLKRNPFCFGMKVAQTIVFTVLLDLIYHDLDYDSEGVENRGGILLIFLFIFNFIPNFNVSMNVAYERSIVLKEIKEGLYRPFIYFFTKAMFEIPMMIYTTFFIVFCTYYVADLNQEESYKVPNTILISILIYIVGFLIGLIAGAVSVTPILSQPIVSTISNGLLLLGGILTDPESPSDFINWLRFISPFYYLRNALLKNEFDDLDLDDDVQYDPEDRYNYTGDISENILMSLVLIVAFAVLALLLLHLQVRSSSIKKN